MARDHQRAEAQDRRQGVDEHRVGGGGADPVRPGPLQRVVHDVHAIIDRDPEDQRDADQVRGIEVDAHQPHQPEGLQHADRQRQRGQEGMADAAEVEPEDGEDHDQRVEPRLLVAPLHLERRLVGLQRVAGGPRIDAPHVADELLQRLEVPDVAPAVDLEEVTAAGADESFDQARRQVGKRRRFGIGDARQRVQSAEQISRRPLLEAGDGAVTLLRPLPPQAVAGPLQVPGRPQSAGPLRDLRLRPGERLAEGIEPIDRNLRRPLRKRGEPAANRFDERPLELLVNR